MTADLLTSKIELLEEQIENIERSGFFTENEIDRAVVSLRSELEMYNMHLTYCEAANEEDVKPLTASEFVEAVVQWRKATEPLPLNFYQAAGKLALDSMKKSSEHKKYGMSDEQYEEGRRKHIELFDKMQAKNPMDIEVVDAQVITPTIQ